MTNYLSLLLFIAASSVSNADSNANDANSDWTAFDNFRAKFHPVYTEENFLSRFHIFRDNLEIIRNHNQHATLSNFTLGVTRFADMTSDEFSAQYLNTGINQGIGSKCSSFKGVDVDSATDSLDWREMDVVNAVKDQGQCGSCWAFSTTGAAESAWAIATNELLDLSEQELVDCSSTREYHNLGCNGGNIDSAFDYQIDHGQGLTADYPYVSGVTTKKNNQCASTEIENGHGASFSACFDVTPRDQLALKSAVEKTPVSVAIEADTKYFQLYNSGVLTGDACGTTLDHAVLIVGYGTENDLPYWTVRNSWGDSWGEDGYIRIERSDDRDADGVCGIAITPSFIVV